MAACRKPRALLLLSLLLIAGVTLPARSMTITMHRLARHDGIAYDMIAPAVWRDSTDTVPHTTGDTLPHERGSYVGIGLVVGNPGAINGVVELGLGNRFVLRASAGTLFIYGYELDALVRIGGSASTDHNLVVGAGISIIDFGGTGVEPAEQWKYVHTGYNVDYNGFNLMISLSVGEGIHSNPWPLVQVGYMLRMQ